MTDRAVQYIWVTQLQMKHNSEFVGYTHLVWISQASSEVQPYQRPLQRWVGAFSRWEP